MRALPRFRAGDDGALSGDAKTAWDRDGCLVVEDFFDPADLDRLKTQAEALVEAWDPGPSWTVFSTTAPEHARDAYFRESGDKIRFFLEDGAVDENGALNRPKALAVNKMGHAMHDLDPVFSGLSRQPRFRRLAQDLGFATPLPLQSMYIFKQPHIGGEVVCHQDSAFLYTEPESCVGLWLAVDAATTENGCLQVIPGAHKAPLRARFREIDGVLTMESLDDSPFDGDPVPVVAEPGTLVILHGRLPHLSGPNHSAQPRHAYTLHLIDGEAHYPADNWLRRGADIPLKAL